MRLSGERWNQWLTVQRHEGRPGVPEQDLPAAEHLERLLAVPALERALDNHDLAATLLPKLQEAGCEVKSAELTERRLSTGSSRATRCASITSGDETRRLDDRAFWAKACDVVDAAIDQIRFARTVEEFAAKATGTIGNPVDVVEVAQKRFDLSEGEGKSVLEHLAGGGDLSLWGLANAVTRTAQDVNSYDRAIELERLGGVVMELKPTDFSKN